MSFNIEEKPLTSTPLVPGIYFLAADIGGTNSNFGIFTATPDRSLALIIHTYSQLITNYTDLVTQIIDLLKKKYSITIEQAVFGIAGIVSEDRLTVKPTNLSITIDAHEIQQKTGISLLLCNDFEVVPLGLNYVAESEIIPAIPGVGRPHGHRGFLGAGTGLGKSIGYWSNHAQLYLPLASEGGHADCAIETKEELNFLQYLQKTVPHNVCPSWENILSGAGLMYLYHFIGTQKNYPETPITQEIAQKKFQPDDISRYAHHDLQCADTWQWYAKFYARCARNYALESLSLGGMYIAGGIAAKNIHIFSSDAFKKEWHRPGKHASYISRIPVFVIRDYYVSLYGCPLFLELYEKGFL